MFILILFAVLQHSNNVFLYFVGSFNFTLVSKCSISQISLGMVIISNLLKCHCWSCGFFSPPALWQLPNHLSVKSALCCHSFSSLTLQSFSDALYEKPELSMHLETLRLFYNKNSLACLLLSVLLTSHYGALSTVLLGWTSVLQCFLEHLMFPKESMIFWQTLLLSLCKSKWYLNNNAFVQME